MPTEPTLTPHAFVAKWRGDLRKERSVSQEHFIDLCRLVGHQTPGENRDGSLAFEASPFPGALGCAGDLRVETIAAAAQHLVELRDAWLNPPDLLEAELKKRTLTNLYNQRPDWLSEAHATLDRAVADAYGWPHDLTDEQILERLLALNLERAAQGGAAAVTTETDEASDE